MTTRLGTTDRAGLIGLHRLAGLLGLIVVATNGVTGAYLALRAPWQNLFLGRLPAAAIPVSPSAATAEPIPRPDLDRLLSIAEGALPGGRNTIISPPRKPGGQWRVRRRQDAEWHPNGRSNVYIDPVDLLVNHMQPTYVEAPWGGYKMSGIGRELGRWGV